MTDLAGSLPVAAAVLGVHQQQQGSGAHVVQQPRAQQGQQQARGAGAAADGMVPSSSAPVAAQRVPLAGVKARVDEARLQSALPLAPKGRAHVPLMLHAPQVPPQLTAITLLALSNSQGCVRSLKQATLPSTGVHPQVATYTGAEEAHLDARLEYTATSSTGNVPGQETNGRRITLPIHLRFLPSLQVRPSHRPPAYCGCTSVPGPESAI